MPPVQILSDRISIPILYGIDQTIQEPRYAMQTIFYRHIDEFYDYPPLDGADAYMQIKTVFLYGNDISAFKTAFNTWLVS